MGLGKMKRFIMAIGDSAFSGTGFGEELRHILFRLAQTGQFDVSWQSLQHLGYKIEVPDTMFSDIPNRKGKVKVYGSHGDPLSFGANAFLKNYRDINPEMVLFMGDPRNIKSYIDYKVRLGFPFINYVTLDGTPIHPQWKDYLKYVNLLVAMTKWAQEEYQKVGLNPAMIHHGVNCKWWKVKPKEKYFLRREHKIPDDAVVFVNWDIPQHRKRPDALLRCWKQFLKGNKDRQKRAILLLYTDWNLGGSMGFNIEGLIKQYKVPRQNIISPIQIQGAPKYWSCYDDETEILSDNGWKLFKDLTDEDKVATLNPKTDEFGFQYPINIMKFPYNGMLVSIKSQSIDLLVTPNHNLYINRDHNQQFQLLTYEHLNKYSEFKKDAKWNGKEEQFFILPQVCEGINQYSDSIRQAKKIPMDLWLEFFGYWLADGFVTTKYRVGVSQSKSKVNINKIRVCLDRLQFKHKYNGKEFMICNKQLWNYLKQFGKSHQKFIPKEIKQLSTRQLLILLDAMILGDGHVEKTKNEHRRYYSTSKKLIDDIQEIFLKTNSCGDIKTKNSKVGLVIRKHYSLKTIYRIGEKRFWKTPLFLRGKKKQISYDGTVYCVEVPNHIIYVRRNGKACWCGNSAETPDQLKKIISMGDIMISTTSGEGFGKTGLEAMAMNIPVIITDYSACSEVHQKGSILVPTYKGRAGRFRPDDRRRSVEAGIVNEKKFVDAMIYLYENEKDRRKLGREARKWSKEFDYDEHIVPQWVKLLGNLDTDVIAAKELLNI